MRKNAFTLAELLISITVGAMVGTLLLGIMINNTNLYVNQASKIQQGVSSNDALLPIRSNIKSAQYVSLSYPETGSPIYTSTSNQLVLKLPTIDASNNLVSNTFDYVIFYTSLQGGKNQLHFKLIPDNLSQKKASDQILSNNVNAIIFDYYDSANQIVVPSQAVKVKVTLNMLSSIATSEASLRNN